MFMFKEAVSWTNTSLVGDPNYKTYNTREVIVSATSLSAFKDYMISLNFSFSYDHAIGLME